MGIVTADFLEDSLPWDSSLADLEAIRLGAKSLDRLDKADCIERYTQNTAGLTSLLVISANISMPQGLSRDEANANSSLLQNDTTIRAGSDWMLNSVWMCSQWATRIDVSRRTCTTNLLMSQIDVWTLQISWERNIWSKVDSCLPLGDVYPMEDKCALRVSTAILVIVTFLNLFKCVCIAYTVHLHTEFGRTSHYSRHAERSAVRRAYNSLFGKEKLQEHAAPYLVTIGDAIASFLQKEDLSTKDMDMASKRDFARGWPEARTKPRFERPKPTHWYRAASKRRSWTTLSP